MLPIITAVYFAVGLSIVISNNPWFLFTKNALSDMGSIQNPKGWMFNTFIVILGILGALTALVHKRKILTMAMLFLIMVGIFPEEYTPHTPSAILFYILSFIDIATNGKKAGLLAFATFLTMIGLVAVGIGLAIPELIGGTVILGYMIYLGLREEKIYTKNSTSNP
ncbi:hypothetical protein PFC_09420 [Pyrococcus furiosus COM1]|nr:hypothetical protein PFC_09420 [Pyrococcus furiosus COM1]MDK2869552.1 hypothetical protein [Pyrococcus sp.]